MLKSISDRHTDSLVCRSRAKPELQLREKKQKRLTRP